MHLELFPEVPAAWRDDELAEKWRKVRIVRRVVTGALEIERAQKRIGSSLEAHPIVHVAERGSVRGASPTSISPRSASPRRRRLVDDEGPADAFRLPDVPGVAVVPNLAEGRKCARSWKISHDRRRRSGLSRRHAARRAGAARMGRAAQGGGVIARERGDGRASAASGIVAAAASPAPLDQASKLYLLFVFDLPNAAPCGSGRSSISCFDRNKGISYGLFQQAGRARAVACCSASRSRRWSLLVVWLARARDRLTAAVARPDHRRRHRQRHRPARLWRGGRFRATFTSEPSAWRFNWYVFNLADVAIVAGVVGSVV